MNYDDFMELYRTENSILSPDEEMMDYLNNTLCIPSDEELEAEYYAIYGSDDK